MVLPAYNEAADLRSCLDAIMAQTVAPYEVIVVDNNSSDDTASIAAEYPGVRVLSEPRQGVVYARTCGFDAARGDIIGRIDADTLLKSNWIETVQRIFSDDAELAAVSGRVRYYDTAWKSAVNGFDHFFRKVLGGNKMFLQGVNMALRRDSWQLVREHVCLRGGLHEDFDLAIHLHDLGLRVGYDDRLLAGISLRRMNADFSSYLNYVRVQPRTFMDHGKYRVASVYIVAVLAVFAYVPCRLLYRGFDPERERFSLRRMLFLNSLARPDPTDI